MKLGNYEVEQLTSKSASFQDEIEQILAICNALLGEGLYTRDRIIKICSSQRHYFFMIKKDNDVVGIFYCYADRLGETELFDGVKSEELTKDMRIGVGQSIALKEAERNTGLSEALLNYGTEILFEREDAEAVLIPAWMKNGVIPARGHLEKCGYRLLCIMEKPWASYETLRCPVCDTIPCQCDGAIYIKWKQKS